MVRFSPRTSTMSATAAASTIIPMVALSFVAPRCTQPEPPQAPRDPVLPGGAGEAAPQPASVLIAEDHEDSRDALGTLLDAFGFRVLVATNGREAVETALAEQPDLVLMDMMMPEVDGFEATRTLRAAPEFRQVPIIALTAMEGARERVMEAGCDDFVSKPIDVRSFLEKVRGWLAAGHPA